MIVTVAALRTELLFAPRPWLWVGVGAGARGRLARWLDRHPTRGVVIVGFCGGTRAALRPGDLVLAAAVATEGQEIAASQTLLELARVALPEAHVGGVATVEAPADPVAKARLGVDALAVDMESAHLAQEFSERGIPFLVLRVVLDALWEDVSAGLRIRWAGRAMGCARRLGQAAAALRPILEGA